MTGHGVAELYRRYQEALGVDPGGSWETTPPVTAEEVARTEQDLGYELPGDLIEMLSIHNGGHVLGAALWHPCHLLPRETSRFHDFTLGLLLTDRTPRALPGTQAIMFAGLGMLGLVYDVGVGDGRILYYDTGSRAAMIELAPSLAALIEKHIELAESGDIRLRPGHQCPSGTTSTTDIPFQTMG